MNIQPSLEFQIKIAEPARRASQRSLNVGELITPRLAVVKQTAFQFDSGVAARPFGIEMEARLQIARHPVGEPAGFDLHILQRDALPFDPVSYTHLRAHETRHD